MKTKDLKCCGNCNYYQHNSYNPICTIKKHPMLAWAVCSNWEFDELEYNVRF
jgi:hypothetical protein